MTVSFDPMLHSENGDIDVYYRVGYNIKKAITEDFFYKDKDSQIAAIEKTFNKAKEPVSYSDTLNRTLCNLKIQFLQRFLFNNQYNNPNFLTISY